MPSTMPSHGDGGKLNEGAVVGSGMTRVIQGPINPSEPSEGAVHMSTGGLGISLHRGNRAAVAP